MYCISNVIVLLKVVASISGKAKKYGDVTTLFTLLSSQWKNKQVLRRGYKLNQL